MYENNDVSLQWENYMQSINDCSNATPEENEMKMCLHVSAQADPG